MVLLIQKNNVSFNLCHKKSCGTNLEYMYKKHDIFGYCMHKKQFLLNHNNILMSTDEVL